MKALPATLSLVLAAALAAHAQEPPAPPLPPAQDPNASLPGGKIVVKHGTGDDARAEVLDLVSADNVDAPLSVRFNRLDTRPNAGPVTFMGVAVSSAPKELATHLPLDPGTGLVVETVSKDSPAEKAGLQPNDILTKLDDQILVHPAQFSVLVALKKEGDAVKLSLLRKGTVREIPVTLGKNESGDGGGGLGSLQLGDVNIQIDGADTVPLRTVVRHLQMDSASGGSGGASGGATIEVNGERLKTSSDLQFKKWQDLLNPKLQDQVKTARDEAHAAMENAKAAAQTIGGELKDQAKQEAVRELEDVLRRLKEE